MFSLGDLLSLGEMPEDLEGGSWGSREDALSRQEAPTQPCFPASPATSPPQGAARGAVGAGGAGAARGESWGCRLSPGQASAIAPGLPGAQGGHPAGTPPASPGLCPWGRTASLAHK